MELSTLTLALAISAASLSMGAASAPFEPISMTIRVGDLDVTRPEGAVIALRRIKAAAGDACGPGPSVIGELKHRQLYRYCLQRNMDAAVEALDAPLVAKLHRRDPSTTVAVR
jgi:UrcA family protein